MIGVLTDSHSNLQNLQTAAAILSQRGVRTAIHCGDICTPASVQALRGLDVHWVFGNCDLDHGTLRYTMEQLGHTCHGLVGSMAASEHRIGFTHGHQQSLLDELINDGRHHYVCHGHSHTTRDDTIGTVRVLNSGALAHARPTTLMVLDTDTGKAEWVVI